MSALPSLHPVADVATALGVTEHYVQNRCRRGEWPHKRLARGRVAFSDEDYARVLELIAADAQPKPEPRMSFAPRSTGLTRRRGAA